MTPDPDDPPVPAVRGHRRGRAWHAVTYGVHRRASIPEGSLADLAAWQLLMTSHSCFTGLSSAGARGWWLPPLPERTPVFMAMHRDDPRPMRAGVRTSRHPAPIPHDVVDGVRLASGEETLLACARVLSLIDLVPVVDHALRVGDVTLDALARVMRARRPGVAPLRTALDRADPRAESGWESLLRLLHESCEAPVEPQFVVRDAAGNHVARADLRVVGTRSLHEYDGAHHREAAQFRQDRRRDREIQAADWVRRGYVASDVVTEPLTVLRDIDRALGRPHDPRRLRPWLALLRDSLHAWDGQVAFARRVGMNRRRRRAA